MSGRRGARSQPRLPQLTGRQDQTLRLVAEGFTDQEIADRFGVSVRTVSRHVETARLVVGARNRAHLVTRAFELAILGGEGEQLTRRIDAAELRAAAAEREVSRVREVLQTVQAGIGVALVPDGVAA